MIKWSEYYMETASMMPPPSDVVFREEASAKREWHATDTRVTAAEAQGSTGRRKVPPRKRRQVTGQLYGDKFNQGDAFDRGNFFFIKT